MIYRNGMNKVQPGVSIGDPTSDETIQKALKEVKAAVAKAESKDKHLSDVIIGIVPTANQLSDLLKELRSQKVKSITTSELYGLLFELQQTCDKIHANLGDLVDAALHGDERMKALDDLRDWLKEG